MNHDFMSDGTPIRTSLRVVDLPPRRGTYENIGTAWDEYMMQRAMVSIVLEDEVKRGTPRRVLARRRTLLLEHSC